MPNVITAGNSSNGGTAITTDTSGTLNIVTGSGSGSNAITIDASQNVAMTASQTIAGNLTVTGTITGTGGVSGGLGTGQTWTNVAGSRVLGTTYTNSTSKPIQVVPTIFINVSSIYAVFINGTQVGEWSTSASAPLGNRGGGGFIIPAGATYAFSITGGSGSIIYWYELR